YLIIHNGIFYQAGKGIRVSLESSRSRDDYKKKKDNNMKIIFILKNMNESSGFYKKTYLDFNI
ncbi:hypothetical protein, partial [Clostridioides difficile]|uniref:hypothetical protein n=1 Tax=Clostridioides difficile TaxID=1496 RepID=UPI000BD822AA